MATIKATCPMCGDVDLTPPEVHVTVVPQLDSSKYEFDCPTCHDHMVKPLDDQDVVNQLRACGCPFTVVEIPAEALEPHSGPPLTGNEIADFVLDLLACDDVATVADAKL